MHENRTFSQLTITWARSFFSNKNIQNISGIFGITILLLIQHRFWLFAPIYRNFTTHIGTPGAAYQSIFVYLQNNLNFLNHQFYSLQAAQFTWYDKIFVINEFNYFPSLIFGWFYNLTNNYITSFNLLFFGNLLLIQLGIYFLTKHYTKNRLVSLLAALAVPLSQSFKTFYTQHIHASLYAGLPFLILFLEIYTKNNNLNRKKKLLLLAGVFIALSSIFLNGWHIITFSSIWLFIWLLFNLKNIINGFRIRTKDFITILTVSIFTISLLVPVALQIQKSIPIYSQDRTSVDISGTNFHTNSFSYTKPFANVLGQLTDQPKEKIEKTFINQRTLLGSYPDILSTISFWIGILVYLPWLFVHISKRGKFFQLEFSLLTVFLITHAIAIGPYPNLFGIMFQQIKLPHYYLYHIFYLLRSIRAVWRATFVGYLALLILWGLILSKLINLSQTSKHRLIKYSSPIIIYIAAIGVLILINNGWQSPSQPGYSTRSVWIEQFDEFTKNGPIDFYDIAPPGESFESEIQRQTTLFVGQYNLSKKSQLINWVSGGGAGSYPDSAILQNLQSHPNYYDELATVLSAKEVDVVTVRDREDTERLSSQLEKYYELIKEDQGESFWKLHTISDETTDQYSTNLSISNTQPNEGIIYGYINQNNFSEQIFTNPGRVTMEEYNLVFEGSDHTTEFPIKIPSLAVLLPNHGKSILLEQKVSNLPIGEVELSLQKDGQKIFTKNIQVIDQDEYQNKVNNQNEQPKFSYNSFTNDYPREFRPVSNLLVDFEVDSGVFSNYANEIIHLRPYIIQSQFFLEDTIHKFPPNVTQPECNIKGSYFEGDQIEFWCFQEIPPDSRFTEYQLAMEPRAQDQFWNHIFNKINKSFQSFTKSK